MDRIIEEKIMLSKICELSVVNGEFAFEESLLTTSCSLLTLLLKYFINQNDCQMQNSFFT